jgi:N-acetylmuramoyl-L-alanine amidase
MRVLTFFLLFAVANSVVADGIESVRVRSELERSRIVFDLNDAVDYRAFQMRNPNRVVIDIQNINYPKSLALPATGDENQVDGFKVLDRMRYAVRNESGLRIVLDLSDRVDLQHTLLPPRQNYGHRLVVDLYRAASNSSAKSIAPSRQTKAESNQPSTPVKSPSIKKPLSGDQLVAERIKGAISATNTEQNMPDNGARALALLNGEAFDEPATAATQVEPAAIKASNKQQIANKAAPADSSPMTRRPVSKAVSRKPPRDVVVAIDAGHGGHDVGAIGPKGTYEKNIVLQVSRELAAAINKQYGMRAVLTRSSDTYVGLRQRMQRARQQQADLFISIHADAFKDRRVKGSSVYVLSQHGASSEAARWLAENENAADLVGGVSLGDKDDVVKSVLIDLSQTASIDASIDAADTVLAALKKLGKVHKPAVQHAGFMVLKSPDIPSLLVETAFISNPSEEAKLRSKSYQRKLAQALSGGVMSYFNDHPLPDTRFADSYRRQHKVNNGDTLSEIAERYAVSMESIKLANEMSRDRVRTGEILTIP